MSKFKIGDKIICNHTITKSDGTPDKRCKKLKEGNVYIVRNVCSGKKIEIDYEDQSIFRRVRSSNNNDIFQILDLPRRNRRIDFDLNFGDERDDYSYLDAYEYDYVYLYGLSGMYKAADFELYEEIPDDEQEFEFGYE